MKKFKQKGNSVVYVLNGRRWNSTSIYCPTGNYDLTLSEKNLLTFYFFDSKKVKLNHKNDKIYSINIFAKKSVSQI